MTVEKVQKKEATNASTKKKQEKTVYAILSIST